MTGVDRELRIIFELAERTREPAWMSLESHLHLDARCHAGTVRRGRAVLAMQVFPIAQRMQHPIVMGAAAAQLYRVRRAQGRVRRDRASHQGNRRAESGGSTRGGPRSPISTSRRAAATRPASCTSGSPKDDFADVLERCQRHGHAVHGGDPGPGAGRRATRRDPVRDPPPLRAAPADHLSSPSAATALRHDRWACSPLRWATGHRAEGHFEVRLGFRREAGGSAVARADAARVCAHAPRPCRAGGRRASGSPCSTRPCPPSSSSA